MHFFILFIGLLFASYNDIYHMGDKISFGGNTYEITGGSLGAGSSGQVYPVVNLETGEHYALKLGVGFINNARSSWNYLSAKAVLNNENHLPGTVGIARVTVKDGFKNWPGKILPAALMPIMEKNLADEIYSSEFVEKTLIEKTKVALKILRDILPQILKLSEKSFFHSDLRPHNIGIYQGKYVLIDHEAILKENRFRKGITRSEFRHSKYQKNYRASLYALYINILEIYDGDYRVSLEKREFIKRLQALVFDSNHSTKNHQLKLKEFLSWIGSQLDKYPSCKSLFH